MNDYIFLLWYMDKNISILNLINNAIESWNKKPKLNEFPPEVIVFNPYHSDSINEDAINGMDVLFHNMVQKGYFQIGRKLN